MSASDQIGHPCALLTGLSDRNTLHAWRIELPLWSCVMRNAGALAPMVSNDFGPPGRAYVETDEAEADESRVIESILGGEYSHPVRVIAFNTGRRLSAGRDRGHCAGVLSKTQSEHRSISIAAQEFLVRTLGVDAPTGG
jgi:hypothetical protein